MVVRCKLRSSKAHTSFVFFPLQNAATPKAYISTFSQRPFTKLIIAEYISDTPSTDYLAKQQTDNAFLQERRRQQDKKISNYWFSGFCPNAAKGHTKQGAFWVLTFPDTKKDFLQLFTRNVSKTGPIWRINRRWFMALVILSSCIKQMSQASREQQTENGRGLWFQNRPSFRLRLLTQHRSGPALQ